MSDLGAALDKHCGRGRFLVTNGPDDRALARGRCRAAAAPVFKVVSIDTLGAGDSFHGGFALALAEGRDEVAAMRFGAAAALKCTRLGISGTPHRQEVDALIR
jgi:sugar/nucleoside kinase (ribokinase family)